MERNVKDEVKKYIKTARIYKTITWRIISWFLTVSITLCIIDDMTIASIVGIADGVLKTIAYWLHETKWDAINYKKIKKIKESIKP